MFNNWLTLGPFTIHGYGVMIAIGILVAVGLGMKRAPKKGLSSDAASNIAFVGILCGFVGAKLLYCLVEFPTFIQNPLMVVASDGFVVYGGIVGGVFGAWVYSHCKHLDFLRYFDLLAPSIALAQGFGRLGCFFAGCCYGAPTEGFWGIVFPAGGLAPSGIKLIPTQLISSAGDFLLGAVLLFYATKNPPKAHISGLYLILYGMGRFGVEMLRGDLRGTVGPLSTSQFIAIFMILGGLVLYYLGPRSVNKIKKNEP